MTLKACLVTVVSLSSPRGWCNCRLADLTADSSNSTTSSSGLRLLVSASANRSNARNLHGCSFERQSCHLHESSEPCPLSGVLPGRSKNADSVPATLIITGHSTSPVPHLVVPPNCSTPPI